MKKSKTKPTRRKKTDTRGFPQVRASSGAMAGQVVLVVDCGSSGVRATIAEIRGQEHRILENLDFDADLTKVFQRGRLTREEIDQVMMTLEAIIANAAAYQVERRRLVATAALREAANGDVLIEAIKQKLGLDLEIIDPAEESRLYYQGYQALLQTQEQHPEQRTALMLDAGRGSIHVSLLSTGTLVGSVNEPLGIDRVLDRFQDLADHPHFATTIDRQLGGSIRRMLGQFQLPPLEGLIVTGHEARDMAELHFGASPGPIARLELPMLEAWWHDESQRSSQERAAEQDGDIWRANRLLIMNSIMRHLGQQTALEHIEVPSVRLRDGLIEDFKPGAPGPYNLDRRRLIASAHQMAERYGTPEAYAKNSASLAEQIFDQTADLHHLGPHERDLLSFASIVHDIGASIHVRNRHLHTAYILRASEIAGLTAEDKEIVALATRLHRSSLPPLDGPEFTVLERRVRVVVLYLASILRLSYALDVERLQRIKNITCRVDGSRLLVVTDRRQVTLERWAARGKGDLFEMVFGLEPVILPRTEGQSG